MLRQHFAKGCGVARQGPPLVPEDGQRLAQRLAAVGQADNLQRVLVRPQGRWNDGDAMPAFSHRQQGVWRAAFKLDAWLEPSEATGGVKVATEYEAAIQEKQGIWRETGDLDGFPRVGQERWMVCRKQVYRFQRMASKARVPGFNCTKQILSKVNFATLELFLGVRPPQNLDQLHLYIGVSVSIFMQEIG